MTNKPGRAENLMDAAAAAIGLEIAAAHRPGVIANLDRIAAMAELVMGFPLPDEVEPAPVFQP
jgi:hypothetical protein